MEEFADLVLPPGFEFQLRLVNSPKMAGKMVLAITTTDRKRIAKRIVLKEHVLQRGQRAMPLVNSMLAELRSQGCDHV